MSEHIVIRWGDDCENYSEDALEFRLTYAGELKAHVDGRRMRGRPMHVHSMRREFHKQIKNLWELNPTLNKLDKAGYYTTIDLEGFNWRPLVPNRKGLICKLDILMLRAGEPGRVIADIDNRLKTLFDALRMANGPDELGEKSENGKFKPQEGEDPFLSLCKMTGFLLMFQLQPIRYWSQFPEFLGKILFA